MQVIQTEHKNWVRKLLLNSFFRTEEVSSVGSSIKAQSGISLYKIKRTTESMMRVWFTCLTEG